MIMPHAPQLLWQFFIPEDADDDGNDTEECHNIAIPNTEANEWIQPPMKRAKIMKRSPPSRYQIYEAMLPVLALILEIFAGI